MKFLGLWLSIVAVTLIIRAPSAEAQRMDSAGRGYCPPGTCSKKGTNRAGDIRNCKKEYCR